MGEGKMFSDGVYGGRAEAERAACEWQRRVDACLPIIPPKPVLKVAKFTLRKDKKGRYYDVYLPKPGRGVRPQTRKLHFKKLENMEKQAMIAHNLVTKRNQYLESSHRLASAAWKQERDRVMKEIEVIWLRLNA